MRRHERSDTLEATLSDVGQALRLFSVPSDQWLAAHRWLVGLSYRLVYFRDPIPANKTKIRLLGTELVHVHGEIYVDGSTARPEAQPSGTAFNFDDHDWQRYSQVGLWLDSASCSSSNSLSCLILALKISTGAAALGLCHLLVSMQTKLRMFFTSIPSATEQACSCALIACCM